MWLNSMWLDSARLYSTRFARYWLTVGAIALAYFLSAKFAFSLVQLGSRAEASVLYPPVGISLAALLLFGRRMWIGVALGAIVFGLSLNNVTWLVALVAAVGSAIEVVAAEMLLQKVGFQTSLRRIRDVIALVGIGAAFSTSLNATISTFNGYFAGLVPLPEVVSHWFVVWLGDGVSILVLTPAILSLGNHPMHLPRSWQALRNAWKQRSAFRRRTVEVGIWLGLLLICSWIVLNASFHLLPPELHERARSLLQYLPFLFIVWAALRLGQRGTVFSAVFASLVAIWAVSQDHQHFIRGDAAELQRSLFQLQVFIGVMTTIAMVLVAAIAERQQAEDLLLKRIQRDQLLAESTLRIRRSLDVMEVLNTTVAEVRRFLQADRVFISLLDEQGFTQVVTESVSSEWRSMLGTKSPMPVAEEIQRIFEQESIRVNSDTETAQKNPFLSLYYSEYQIKASVGIPILQDKRIFGILNVNQCSGPRQWQPFEIELLDRLATQVELALQQGRLHQQVQNFANHLEQQVKVRTLQLQQNMEELQALNEVKDTLLHAVTHDLRTPVIGMLMVLRRLQSKPNDPLPLPRSTLDRMIESGDRQLNLIKSLLEDYSQESQELILNHEAVHFPTLVQETLQDLEPLLSEYRVDVKNSVPWGLPLLSADPIHLRRVLENLITNALKHNPPGITIAVEAIVEGENEAWLRCTIVDDGIGIAQEQCDQLFKKPYLRGSHNRHRTGLGLGLFLCAQIIDAHHGQIGVNSVPDEGTEFWFTLPLSLDYS